MLLPGTCRPALGPISATAPRSANVYCWRKAAKATMTDWWDC